VDGTQQYHLIISPTHSTFYSSSFHFLPFYFDFLEELSSGIAGSRTINNQNMLGWTPDSSQPCYGLPGAIAPLGYFDPLGFCQDRSLEGVKRFREAEIM